MKIERAYQCDVLVVGAGIAGVRAALAAKEQGSSVILAAQGNIFSGSSFYPGTWGLGLVAPDGKADEADLCTQILTVGCGMAEPTLVKRLVSGIASAITQIQQSGIRLKEAQAQAEPDFIPCFDHKHRAWHGILFDSVRQVWQQALADIPQLPHSTLLALTEDEQGISGAVFYQKNAVFWIACRSVVLATGGCSGLFQHRLTTNDVTGMGQYLAVQSGAQLVNIEFMQMMPGIVHPCYGTVFNEKTFRYAHFYDGTGKEIAVPRELLAQRGTYGPFTSRLLSRAVDALFAEKPVIVRYDAQIESGMPEFIQTYFRWLEQEKGVTPRQKLAVSSFAHASNGGIRIDGEGFTGVPGLYACGEVTGGMHGADRIGGLSTANGLVFGGYAGAAAARAAHRREKPAASNVTLDTFCIENCRDLREQMRQIMQRACMVNRCAEELTAGIEALRQMQQAPRSPAAEPQTVADSLLLAGQLALAEWMLRAVLLRQESRGSHHRVDFPQTGAVAKRIIIASKGVFYEK